MSKLKSYNPANNEMLGSVKISSVNEIKQKVSNAKMHLLHGEYYLSKKD